MASVRHPEKTSGPSRTSVPPWNVRAATTELPISAASVPARNAGLDALRAAVVLLVVFHHTAITYGATGGWYYHEATPAGALTTKLLTLLCAVDQAFFMGLLFLLAGYFATGSLARHGALGYLRERLLRLGIPMLAFGFVLGPMTLALAGTAQGRPFTETLLALLGRGAFVIGPLWFALALLIFTGVFVAWRSLVPEPARPLPFPSNGVLAIGALATAAAAFALRLVWPVGTEIFGLQLGYFASYVVLFAAGCLGARGQWLSKIPPRQRRLWLLIAAIAVAVLAASIFRTSAGGTSGGSPLGGWSVSAAFYALWEPLVAWGVILGLVHLFGRAFSHLNRTWAALARRSYAIYVIHPLVLVAIALAWRQVPAPHLLKFALTGAASCLACFWIAGGLLRVPGVGRVL